MRIFKSCVQGELQIDTEKMLLSRKDSTLEREGKIKVLERLYSSSVRE